MKSFDFIPLGNGPWHEYERRCKAHIVKELTDQTEEYILNVNEEEYINYLVEEKYIKYIYWEKKFYIKKLIVDGC